jgi:hypothetical protein
MPTNGFNGSQLSSGLAWGKIDLTDAFNYDISTIKNIFLKYHLFVTEIIFPNTLSSFETQCLRWSDNIQSVTFPFWDGTQGVTGWATAFGYKHYCVINVPEEAISWYQSQSQYSGCTILPIL